MDHHLLLSYIAFHILVFCLLIFDLGLASKSDAPISAKRALSLSLFYVIMALAFGGWIAFDMGHHKAMAYFTGYVVEKSLSIDNIFIFFVIFQLFKVPANLQHRVLFWGIIGALIMRGALIYVGAIVLAAFHWVIYIFGVFLIITGWKLFFKSPSHDTAFPERITRWLGKIIPVTQHFHGKRFFIKEAGRMTATPLLTTLIVIEVMDVIFALDSIPAIFAITQDPFIVYTSNVFAILGLRALYFALNAMVSTFCYLNYGLALTLAFIGSKIIVNGIFGAAFLPLSLTLSVTILLIGGSIVASLWWPPKAR